MEVEAKILEVDAAALTRKLVALGAKKTFDGTHEAYSFDDKDGTIKNSKSLLRIRREKQKTGEVVTLTFKRKASKTVTKQAHEYEVQVSSFATANKIIEGLGFRVVRIIRKRRIEYKLGDAHYCLDTPEGIPTYLEIESTSQAKVIAAAARLGIAKKELKPWTLPEVLRHYGKK